MYGATASHPVHAAVSRVWPFLSLPIVFSPAQACSSQLLNYAFADDVTSYFTCFFAFHILPLINSRIEFSQYSPYSCILPPEKHKRTSKQWVHPQGIVSTSPHQTVWVIAVVDVGQSQVALNQSTLVVIGCEQNYSNMFVFFCIWVLQIQLGTGLF